MSRNLDLALHLGQAPIELPDTPPPAAGAVLAAGNVPAAGTPVQVVWQQIVTGGSGGAGFKPFPDPTKEGDVLVGKRVNTAHGPDLDWQPGEIDAGRY